MALPIKTEHLKRYRDIAWLLVKYGRSDLVAKAGLTDALEEADVAPDPQAISEARGLAADLERLGPTFVKLGQLLSTRVDVMPPLYTKELTRLQDRVEPFPFEDVESII